MKPVRRLAALRAAETSVWSDGRLLGLPDARWPLVQLAARFALNGIAVDDDVPTPSLASDEDADIVRAALIAAVHAANLALADHSMQMHH